MMEQKSVPWLSYSPSYDWVTVSPMIVLASAPWLGNSPPHDWATVHPMMELLYCPSHDGANNNSLIHRSFIYRSSNTSQIIISQLGHFQFYSFIIYHCLPHSITRFYENFSGLICCSIVTSLLVYRIPWLIIQYIPEALQICYILNLKK